MGSFQLSRNTDTVVTAIVLGWLLSSLAIGSVKTHTRHEIYECTESIDDKKNFKSNYIVKIRDHKGKNLHEMSGKLCKRMVKQRNRLTVNVPGNPPVLREENYFNCAKDSEGFRVKSSSIGYSSYPHLDFSFFYMTCKGQTIDVDQDIVVPIGQT